jgi:hypothetical protein
MDIHVHVSEIRKGVYSAIIGTPNGACVIDGASVEGVCRAIVVAIVDALEECLDLACLDEDHEG